MQYLRKDFFMQHDTAIGQTNGRQKTYTQEDVAAHNSKTDCWIIIEGNVYNATSFVAKHPGGAAILNGCGMDATMLFHERPASGKGPHPDSAAEVLKTLYIGKLVQ